jgi:hypothetical protein
VDKTILDIVNDFTQWKGNSFALANLIVEAQKDIDRAKLVAADMPEAAELI